MTDNQTKLVWRRCAEGMSWDGSTCAGVAGGFTYDAALGQAVAASTGIAWRLPNIKELSSIVDRSRINPAIDPTAFPGTPSNWFWSGSPRAGALGTPWGVAWAANFGDGYVDYDCVYYGYRISSVPVRLVRASQ